MRIEMAIEELLDADDARRLELTQTIREKYIIEMDERGIPEKTGELVFLVQLLDGMDKSVLNKSKIKIEDQANKTESSTAKLIADVLLKHKVSQSIERDVTPELPSDLPTPVVVEGELDQTISELNYQKFVDDTTE